MADVRALNLHEAKTRLSELVERAAAGDEEARTNPSVYLVAKVDLDEEGPDTTELAGVYGTDLFETELSYWAREERWPPDRSPGTFRQYFDLEVSETIEDLDDDEPLDTDDADEDVPYADPEAVA